MEGIALPSTSHVPNPEALLIPKATSKGRAGPDQSSVKRVTLVVVNLNYHQVGLINTWVVKAFKSGSKLQITPEHSLPPFRVLKKKKKNHN